MRDIKKDIILRVYLVYLGVLLFGLAIMSRAVYIQSFEGEKLMEMARQQEMRWFDVEATRGNILAEDGTLLATSVPIFDIRMDVMTDSLTDEVFARNVDSLSICLASLFKDKKAYQYKDLLWDARRNKERYLLIQRDITYPDLKLIRRFPIFRRGKYKGGLIVIPNFRRELPFKDLAKRTIGYESDDTLHKIYVGIEGSFTKNLHGTDGKRLMRRVSSNNWVPLGSETQIEPLNGADLVTTIDINLQDLAEDALLKELRADSADHGCVVVMEVKTGYVKAIANLGRTKKGTYEETFNYAVGESSEPGSTFKLASFLVALEDGKIDLNTQVNTTGGVARFANREMNDSHHGGYGVINAEQAFEKSSNVGTSKLIYGAYASEPQKYIDGLYRLSINKPLGLQFSGEGLPYIKNTKSKYWSAVSLPWMSIGYEVALTPLQLLTLYNAVANNGKMVRPLFVSEIRQNGQVVEQFPPEVINPAICSPATIQKALILLKGVVNFGTATSIKSPLYQIAGKTGTALVAINNKGYGDERNVRYKGSFVGFFPADNPKYSCIVVVNNPSKGKYYGGAVAAPVFREIADHLYAKQPEIMTSPQRDTANPLMPFAQMGTQSDLKTVFSGLGIATMPLNDAAIWVKPLAEGNKMELYPEPITKGVMPDVSGMGLKDALYLLEGQGLMVLVNGKGTVARQSLAPGTPVRKGMPVVIELMLKPGQTAIPEPVKEKT
jgi:cell division protein FtsI (penicillin-binding protein 3)